MPSTVQQRAAHALTIPVTVVKRIARSAPYRYKVYTIPKRSGRGVRTIAQPAKEVKAIQRWLIDTELGELPIHEAATAYRPGSSIRGNAERHVGNNYLLKADLRNFFPSIKECDIRMHLDSFRANHYSAEELDFICRILLWRPTAGAELQLSIGAPSSPFVSNSVMYAFDSAVQTYCLVNELTYSRYADDMAFSSKRPNVLSAVSDVLVGILRDLRYPTVTLNRDKLVSTSRKHHRSVTGLVLSSQGKVSLGRERKRLLRAMVHHFENDRLTDEEAMRLRGLLAFASDVEPAFIRRLEAHVSERTLQRIRCYRRAVRN